MADDEDLAGTLLNAGIVTAEAYWEFLSNPFTSSAVNSLEGWDQGLACLTAISQDDWNNAASWAAWSSDGRGNTSPEYLVNALYETARLLGIPPTAQYTELASYLATLATTSPDVLQIWRRTLYTVT
ncbi:hypothetical protein JHN49_41120, partial [Streptomyces sp. MBT57]|nr:hypothetical protein [Streptomyces sp. MBT57]